MEEKKEYTRLYRISKLLEKEEIELLFQSRGE